MRVLKKSWLLALTIFCVAFASNARATRKTQHPSAAVVGTVYCDSCFQNRFSKLSHFIPGALVAVECDDANISQRFRTEVKTDKHGQFKVNLPFSVTNHVKKIKKCTVNLVHSNDVNCAVASIARTTSLTLKSRKARTNIFSAGFFTFKPLTQPNTCNQKQNNLKDSLKKYDPSFPPPLRDPPSSIVPPIDNPGQFTPIPILPRLPPLPQLPINLPPLLPPQESTHKKTSNDLLNQNAFFLFPPLIPNPLQPPPAIIPPIIPSPPPSIFPPIFPSPPPSIFPPIPGFTPPVPSLPPPSPVIPFLPPGFPGVPPATTSVQSKDTKHH